MVETKKRELLIYLVKRLFKERLDNGGFMHPKLSTLLPARKTLAPDADPALLADTTTEQLWLAFRVLVNVREPWPADTDLLAAQDELLYRKLLAIGE